jgi:hypothetical protein
MAAGLKIRDATSGQLIVDLTDRLTQFCGSTAIAAGSSGSVTATARQPGNKMWAVFVPDAGSTSFTPAMPKFTFSANSVSWEYTSISSGTQIGGTLLYGIY